ncbi:MAG: hypothetical protein LJE68_00990 [Rhodobacter sp.]|nr:hypothetical protein [Rhodobacter sp.]
MSFRFAVIPLVVSLQCSAAFAGPVAEFEGEFAGMYASYRMALFATNSGDGAKSAKALGAFDGAWSALTADYGQTPPPQYEDDAQWSAMIAEVQGHLDKAKAEAGAGELGRAHVTLEAIREAFGALHARNGVETFSDRMNAYHAEMEHVLEMDMSVMDAGLARRMLEHAAVLSYLAGDVLQAPPAGAEGMAEYAGLAAAFQASVAHFVAAARSGDAAALKVAVGGLKGPYSKFFLKFG